VDLKDHVWQVFYAILTHWDAAVTISLNFSTSFARHDW